MPVKEKSRNSAAVALPTDAHLYQQPTEELLLQLIGKEMYSKWNSFGVNLGIKQNVCDGIKQQTQGDPEACFIKLCSKWLNSAVGTGEKPRTWKTVLNAVRECEYPQVADDAEKTLLLRLTKTDIAMYCVDKYKDQLESLVGLTKKTKELRDLYLMSAWISFLVTVCRFCLLSSTIFQGIIYQLKEAMKRDHENMDIFCTFLRLEFSGNATAVKIASDMKGDYDRGTSYLKDNVANFIDSEDNRDPVAADTEGCLRIRNRDEGYSAWCSNNGWIVTAILIVVLAIIAYTIHGSGLQDESMPNLPGLPTAFTGRSEEVDDILSAFLLKQIQVVAITGGPGYGKSSLAIVCAHELARKGFNVHHISLNEVNTTVRFTSKVLLAVDELHNDKQQEDTFLKQIRALKQTTVLVLDNADQIFNSGLETSSTMSSFLVLLRKMTSASSLLKMIVTTRFRFNMIDGFRQIHLQALSNSFTVDLLSSLLLTSSVSKSSQATNSVHIQQIANLTGGIPLAVKVVCQLLNSQVISMDEVVEGLSVRPVHTLSHETFSPEERLNRCFNLSYTYLSKPAKLCFVYASRFPVAFSIEAGRAIAAALTTDPDCLPKLVDRSLLEYDVHTKRYSMHLLLRHFVQEQESVRKGNGRKWKFWKLYVKFYMDQLLSLSVSSNKRMLKALYFNVDLEYEHFLLSLSLLSEQRTSQDDIRILIPINNQIEIAEKTFHLVQMTFLPAVLTKWWFFVLTQGLSCESAALNNQQPLCYMQAHGFMFLPYVSFARKFGRFWLHGSGENVNASLYVYEFAFKSTQGNIRSGNKITVSCELMHMPEYGLFLQDLANVYTMLPELRSAQTIYDVIDLCGRTVRQKRDPSLKLTDILPEDKWCTSGFISAEKSFQSSRRYAFISTFDYLFLLSLCKAPDDAMQELQDLEANLLTSEFVNAHTHSQAMLSMSKVWDQLYGNVSREVFWLEKAASVLGDEPSLLSNQIKFEIHFRLARLYFTNFDNNISKALYHSQAAYDLAESALDSSTKLFKSVFRLANLLFANESFNSSLDYFQQAAIVLPLVDSSMEDDHILHHVIRNRLLKLALLGIRLGGVRDYYQWYKADLKSSAIFFTYGILASVYQGVFMSPETDLTLSDVTYSKVDEGSEMLRIFKTVLMHVSVCSFYIRMLILCVSAVALVIAILVFYFLFVSVCMSIPCCIVFYPINACLYYYVVILLYSFHYFLYSAIRKGQLWLPTRLPVISEEFYLIKLKRVLRLIFGGVIFVPLMAYGMPSLIIHYLTDKYMSDSSLEAVTSLLLDEITLHLH